MKKWMIFIRESDGTYFLYNGEGCIRISPVDFLVTDAHISGEDQSPRWHHDYGELPEPEISNLDKALVSKRTTIFQIKGYGRYQVIARGEFKGL